MSRLDDLIAELCPDGVEYRELGEIALPTRGVRVIRSQLELEGEYPVFQNSMIPLGYYEKSNCPANTTFVISAGAAGEVGYSTVDFWAADDCFYFICPEQLQSRFLYYVLMYQQEYLLSRVRRASVPRLARSVIENLKIPLPPLPIQQEIVRILDKFTALEAELEAELEARMKQYEYYRDDLLTFNNDVPMVKLGDVAVCYAGATPKTNKKEYWENGFIPWMSSGEVNLGQVYITEQKITKLGFDMCSTKMVPANTVVVALAGQGKTRGMVAITRIPLCTNQSLCSIIPNEKVNSNFLYYYLKTQYEKLRLISSGDGTRGGLNLKMLKEYIVPVPPLAEQERIVSILDRFDTLVNDITQGLPAEIAARRKQYEYYRNKLLTFKEKVS